MKALVTGGSGFIGSWLVDKLIENENKVIVVDNLSVGEKNNVNGKAIFYQLDICDNERLNKIFEKEKPEIIFHLAANSLLRKSLEDPIFDAQNNILGTISVLECCRKNNARKLIYTSTGGARVGEPLYLPVDEKHPLHPSSPYGISKHSAEHYVEMYGKLCGIDYFIFCFGNVYGPRDNPESKRIIPVFITKILKNEKPIIFGDGNQTRDFIYVLDLADFLIESIDKLGGTDNKLFHLANGEQISVNKVVELLRKISCENFTVEHHEAIKGEVRDIVLDIRLAEKELEWKPKTDIEQGLKETWEWFKRNKET
ncbi:NAD-dependent epimerase/dehydratase family protein [Candidatus Pacearchaeota archaeon]|nr:NAD-dependent epimerase/dehydratase family protein [Candidatus Pacearchaeota archaeon]